MRVSQLGLKRKKKHEEEIRVSLKIKKENAVWYIRLPKWLRDLGKIPAVLNWELIVKPHPSGNPLLSEIVLKPTQKEEEKNDPERRS